MVTLPCPACAAALPEDARFCGACGARLPDESPADVARYAEALAALGHRDEAWARDELAALRRELRIRSATHDRLARPAAAPAPVALEVDAVTLEELRAGEQGLVRLRVRNDGARAVTISVTASSTASREGAAAAGAGVTGPGESLVVQLLLRPELAGHHTLRAELELRAFGGAAAVFHSEELPFRVGAPNPLQQSIHIDARAQRVGIFENIGAASRGGLVAEARWRPVGVASGPMPAPAAAPAPGGARLPAAGSRAAGVVVRGGEVPELDVDGARGALVELDDPALRAILAPGDRLQVTVIGHDGQGGLLLSTRPPRPAAPAAPVGRVVGPGDDLRAALAAAPAGAQVRVTGTHIGPFVVDRPLELSGDGVLEAARGPVLALAADVVVRGLTVRGAAPPGGYAADAVEVRAGRVVLDGCALSSDAPGNLTPGRALAVVGPATVELRGGTVRDAALGVAIDVSWSGFPTDGAPGAKVAVVGTTFARVGTAVTAAGAGRAVTVSGCDLTGATERAVHVTRGAAAVVERCRAAPRALVADAGGSLIVRDG